MKQLVQNENASLFIQMVNSAGEPLDGLTLTVDIVKNNQNVFSLIAGSSVEVAGGTYKVNLLAADLNILGHTMLRASAAGAETQFLPIEVVQYRSQITSTEETASDILGQVQELVSKVSDLRPCAQPIVTSFNAQGLNDYSCNTDIKYARFSQKEQKELVITLYDSDGVELNLNDLSVGSSSSSADNMSIIFIGKTTIASPIEQWNIPATILDSYKGLISVYVSESDVTKESGLYVSNFLIYIDDVLRYVVPYYVEVTSNTLTDSTHPITIAEVRLELRDTCPEANVLLDTLEFSDSEIIYCIRKCIDEFNSVSPKITSYSVSNFPYRSQWVNATVGHLLRIAARSYARNHLPYSAGGVSIDDKNKLREYEGLADKLLNDWINWVQQTKIEMNIARGYGHFGSQYRCQ